MKRSKWYTTIFSLHVNSKSNKSIELQSNMLKRPCLKDDHLTKMASAESAQPKSYTIVTVYIDHLSNTTNDHFYCAPNEEKPV